MKLKTVYLSYQTYGAFQGKYTGHVEFEGLAGEMKILLPPELSSRILAVCAELLVTQAKETAQTMTATIIDQVNNTLLTDESKGTPE